MLSRQLYYVVVLKQKVNVYAKKHGNRETGYNLILMKQTFIISEMAAFLYLLAEQINYILVNFLIYLK